MHRFHFFDPGCQNQRGRRGDRLRQRPGCAERLQLLHSRDSSDGADHPGQAALGPVHVDTGGLHSHLPCPARLGTPLPHPVHRPGLGLPGASEQTVGPPGGAVDQAGAALYGLPPALAVQGLHVGFGHHHLGVGGADPGLVLSVHRPDEESWGGQRRVHPLPGDGGRVPAQPGVLPVHQRRVHRGRGADPARAGLGPEADSTRARPA